MPDDVFHGRYILEGNQHLTSPSAEQLMELPPSFCPDNRSEESNKEEGTSRRCFSCLASVIQQLAVVAGVNVADSEDHHGLCPKERGKVFQQNVAVMWDSLHGEVVLPSSAMESKVAPVSSVQK